MTLADHRADAHAWVKTLLGASPPTTRRPRRRKSRRSPGRWPGTTIPIYSRSSIDSCARSPNASNAVPNSMPLGKGPARTRQDRPTAPTTIREETTVEARDCSATPDRTPALVRRRCLQPGQKKNPRPLTWGFSLSRLTELNRLPTLTENHARVLVIRCQKPSLTCLNTVFSLPSFVTDRRASAGVFGG